MKDTLDGLAEQILRLDPDELKGSLPEIQARMATPDDSDDWARAVVSFFIINALSFKDNLRQRGHRPALPMEQGPPSLRLVK